MLSKAQKVFEDFFGGTCRTAILECILLQGRQSTLPSSPSPEQMALTEIALVSLHLKIIFGKIIDHPNCLTFRLIPFLRVVRRQAPKVARE